MANRKILISYTEFLKILHSYISYGDDFYYDLLCKIIDYPSRYCGLFRLSNIRSKLLQNVTQSREIKFGDFIEELSTEYISILGYRNFAKDLGYDSNGDKLNVDQYFTDGQKIYFCEMKIRDDHDSTKKRGQYENFQKKLSFIKLQHPNQIIDGSMWFVDETLIKNKKYYLQMMKDEPIDSRINLHLYYGSEFFRNLANGDEAWNEIINYLEEYRLENANKDDIDMPDFGSSEVIYEQLLRLSDNYIKKLFSNNVEYELLRNELFGNGDNLEKLKKERNIK